MIKRFILVLSLTLTHAYLAYRLDDGISSVSDKTNGYLEEVTAFKDEDFASSYLSSYLRYNGHCSDKPSFLELANVKKEISDSFSTVTKYLATSSDDNVYVSFLTQASISLELNILDTLDHSMSSNLCFSCSKMINEINEQIDDVIQALEEHFPGIKELSCFKTFIAFINTIISVLSDMCVNQQSLNVTHNDNMLSPVALFIFSDKHSCLSPEQKDDVQELLELAGNLLNTFSEWFRESEQKAKSKELKYVLEKLAEFLDKEKDFIENHGESTVEYGCKKCSQIVHLATEFINLAETGLKTVVPFWKSLPHIEKVIESINSFLGKAREICPYEFSKANIGPLTLSTFEYMPSTDEQVINLKLSLLGLLNEVEHQVSRRPKPLSQQEKIFIKELSGVSKEVLLDFSSTYLSCKEMVQTVDSFLNRIESLLDMYLPKWRKLPIADIIDNFIHDVLMKFKEKCPSFAYYLTKHSKRALQGSCISSTSKVQLKSLSKQISIDTFQLPAITSMVKGDLESQALNPIVFKFNSILFKLQSYVEYEGYWAEKELCFMCDFGLEELSKLKKEVEELKFMFKDMHRVQFFIGLLEAKLDEMLHAIKSICSDNSLKINEYQDINYDLDIAMNNLILKLDLNKEDIYNFHLFNTAQIESFHCEDFVENIETLVSKIESALTKHFPNWEKLPLIPELENFIHMFLDTLKTHCMSDVKGIFSLPLIKKSVEASYFINNCLTEKQKERLGVITTELKTDLDIIATVLQVRAEFEMNSVKKFELEEVSKVIHIFAAEVVTNLTRLSEEFCGNCEDLIDAVEDMFQVLEDAMFDIVPMWKSTPVYNDVKSVTKKLFEKLQNYCKKDSSKLVAGHHEHCLTPEETTTFKGYIASIDGVVTYAVNVLDSYAQSIPNEALKEEILQVANKLHLIDIDLIDTLTNIADETCGTCLDIMHGLKDFETAVENTLSDVDKDWKNNQQYAAIDMAVSTAISLMKRLCPTKTKLSEDTFITQMSILKQRAENFPNGFTGFQSLMDRESLLLWLSDNGDKFFNNFEGGKLQVSELGARVILFKTIESITMLLINEDEKEELNVLLNVFNKLELTLANNAALKSGCGVLVDALDSAIHEIKVLIEKTFPNLKNSDAFNEAVNIMEQLLDVLHDYCPDRA